jgi:pimeloyl-ACP methyl ester carboxylesterase
MPERLKTVSPVSVPHPAAFLKSFLNSRQGLASFYMYLFQLPRIPEWTMLRRNGSFLSMSLRQAGQSPAVAQRDAQAMLEPGALTAAINWYRAMPLSNPRAITQKVSVPTLYVWSDGDIALMPKSAHNTGRYVDGEYRFEILRGVSHWIPEEQPDKPADLLLEWFAAH